MLSIYILILIQCNPYHLANPSSRSKHDVMCVNLLHLSMSLTHMTSCLLHLERKGGHFDRFVYNFQYFNYFLLEDKINIYLDKGSIFNKGQGKKLSVRFKGFLNLCQTMKFVPDFCHTLSISPVHDKIHGLRQIKKPFKSN